MNSPNNSEAAQQVTIGPKVMLGFAIVDRQPAGGATAIWSTGRTGTVRVSHTNAVVIQDNDPANDSKVDALTYNRSVVLTVGTVAPRKFAHTLKVDDFAILIEETGAHQKRISQAVTDYATRTRNRNLVMPSFPSIPEPLPAVRDEPALRALSVANYVADAWAAWLATDEQRLRRTVEPRTGASPWIMPEELNSPALTLFPSKFSALVKPERGE